MRIHRNGAPIKVRRFYVTEALRFTRGDEQHIGWDKIIVFEPNDIPDSNIFPFLLDEG
jgi:hypothetical protein